MARPKGTTRAKKPILKTDYEKLMQRTKNSLSVKSATRVKLQRAFTLLYLTGCRVSEITRLHAQDVQKMIDNNEYSLTNNTKTGLPRLITFDVKHLQVEILKSILPSSDVYLFARNNSTEPMTTSALTALMNKFIQAIFGELYSTHSFRAGYVTIAHQSELSLEHIREDIGHKNITTTARYATVTSREISHGKNKREW
jgi:site-specific recombinase XerD